MDRQQIALLLSEAHAITNLRDYVIIGSLSVLGVMESPPPKMAASIDVDLYPLHDPGRASEIADKLGLSSSFAQTYGFYADAVSPMLPTLPDGWESRLNPIRFEKGITAWFLEPNDTAISKYVRLEERDRLWIWAGLEQRILSLPTIEYRMRNDTIVETEERERAYAAIAEDKLTFSEQTDLGSEEMSPSG